MEYLIISLLVINLIGLALLAYWVKNLVLKAMQVLVDFISLEIEVLFDQHTSNSDRYTVDEAYYDLEFKNFEK